MEVYIEKQLIIVGYSIILGLIFGVLYDIIRIVHILCGIASYSGEKQVLLRGKVPFVIFFITDLLYMLCVTAILSFFTYWMNSGVPRFFIIFSSAAGFVLYLMTVGRLVMFFSEALVCFIRVTFNFLVIRPIRFILRMLKNIVCWIYSHTFGKIFMFAEFGFLLWRTEIYRKHLRHDVCFGKMDGKG